MPSGLHGTTVPTRRMHGLRGSHFAPCIWSRFFLLDLIDKLVDTLGHFELSSFIYLRKRKRAPSLFGWRGDTPSVFEKLRATSYRVIASPAFDRSRFIVTLRSSSLSSSSSSSYVANKTATSSQVTIIVVFTCFTTSVNLRFCGKRPRRSPSPPYY